MKIRFLLFSRSFNLLFYPLPILLFPGFFFLFGCDLINPAEPVPGYIKVEKFNTVPDPALGTDSSKITDVYVYIDTKFIGSYPLPAQFPVIETGSHQMIFYAGVIINGISNSRVDYPFYDSYEETVLLEPGKITTVTPQTKYSVNTVASWMENFENAGLTLVKGTGTSVGITKLSGGDANNFEGKSGAVYLDANAYFQLVTDTSFVLPKANSAVFLEMNYKCNNAFNVGVLAVSSTSVDVIPVVTFRSKSSWNKVYVELGSIIRGYPAASSFKIELEAYKEEGISNAEFYFDNFKLLHN